MFTGELYGCECLVAVVAIQQKHLWIFEAAVRPVSEMSKPLQEQIRVDPAAAARAADGSRRRPGHQSINVPFPRPDEHRGKILPRGVDRRHHSDQFTPLSAGYLPDASFSFCCQYFSRDLDRGDPGFVGVPDLPCGVLPASQDFGIHSEEL